MRPYRFCWSPASFTCSILSLFLGLAVLSSPLAAGVTVRGLKCEHLLDPLGIDTARPRLSWVLESDERGQRQTACQILVASTLEGLSEDRGDRWNSGKVVSSESVLVPYAGKDLVSHDDCYWKVRVWDKDGKPSPWSTAARWSMGILRPDQWQAYWIGKDEPNEVPAVLSGTNWIWFPEGNPTQTAPAVSRFFRRGFRLPADGQIQKAELLVTADDMADAFLNGEEVLNCSGHQVARRALVADRLMPGHNVLTIQATNGGTGPNPAALAVKLRVEFNDREPITLTTDEEWKTTDQEKDGWKQPAFDDGNWKTPVVLGAVGEGLWGEVRLGDERRLSARYLRKEFHVQKPVRRATVYFSGLGLGELYVNGAKIGDHVLSPGLTEYTKRVFYVTHDVTEQIQQGENALGVILGNGRYYAPRLKVPMRTITYGYPKLLLHLRVEHEDGSVSTITSEPSWKLSTEGPILANNEYDGEDYDARKEFPGWSQTGFDDSAWPEAAEVTAPEGRLAAQMCNPIRVTETVQPKSVKEIEPGRFIFDLGQNIVGWCRLKVRGPAGTVVRLRHAEVLKPDGGLYLANLRSCLVTDVYTLKGEGLETWEPRFIYHGFRFVEVTGFPGKPGLDAIEGRVVHDDLPIAGEFECSSPLLNQVYRNAIWGVRGNYRSMPTDCPQRDERHGWLGDRGSGSLGESYLFDHAALYSKWLMDMEDAQRDSGSVPDVCPPYWPLYNDNVTWPSTTVFIPEMLHRQFGDRRIVACHYESAKRWVNYMTQFLEDGLISRDNYGDWCVPPEEPEAIHTKDPSRITDKTLLATSFYYQVLRDMEQAARLLGYKEDSTRFAELAEEVGAAFNRRFYNAELGQYDNGTQTSSVLPLAFGLVPEGEREKVFATLVRNIEEETHGHVGTGLIGAMFLNRVLNDHGRPDLAYRIATQEDYPSFGYMISKGATTIWELWNGDTANPAMNSGNHVMLLGDLMTWIHEDLAGVAPDEGAPGFKKILLRPQPVEGLEFARAWHNSPYGRIASHWRREPHKFVWEVTVPPNTTATAFVPAASADAVTESATRLDQAPGVELLRQEEGRVVLLLGSGVYRFESETTTPTHKRHSTE